MQQLRRIMRHTFLMNMLRYLGICLLVILSLLPLYFFTQSSARQAVVDRVEQTIRKDFEKLEDRLAQLPMYADRLAENETILRLALATDSDQRFPYALYATQSFYKTSLWDYGFVQNVMIQFARNSAMVSVGKVYQQKSIFFETALIVKEYSLSELDEFFYTRRLACIGPVTITGDSSGEMILLNYYYNAYKGKPSIVITFVIPVSNLIDAFIAEDIRDYCSVTLSHMFQNASYTIERSYRSEENVVSFTLEGRRSPLFLSMDISSAFFKQSTQGIRHVLIAYIAIALFVALVLSVILTFRSLLPLRHLLDTLAQLNLHAGEERSWHALIARAINAMRSRETGMQEDYSRLRSYHSRHVLRMLLNGIPVSEEDCAVLTQNTPVLQRQWRFISAEMDRFEEETEGQQAVAMLALKQQLMEAFPGILFMNDAPLHAVMEEQHAVTDALLAIVMATQRAFGVYARFGISLVMSSPMQIKEAYEQADGALAVLRRTSEHIRVFDVSQRDGTLPSVNAEQLTTLLVDGTPDMLARFFQDILRQLEASWSTANAQVVYYGILSIYQQVSAQYRQPPPTPHAYEHWNGAGDALAQLEKTGCSLQSALAEQKQSMHNKQAENLIAYIDSQLSNSDLCLSMAADAIAMSDRKVSALVMRFTGMGFADYVESKRMELAKRYLRESTMPIGDVGQRVGYAHASTFYRAFRQHTGVSPSQYRSNRQSRQ